MKSATLFVFLLVCSIAIASQERGRAESRKAPRAMCDAAASQLHESGTTEVVLTMILDTRGKVESFKTESPKGLRLENMNEASAAIKAIQFEQAKKNGQPVRYAVKVKFDCSEPATDAPKKP